MNEKEKLFVGFILTALVIGVGAYAGVVGPNGMWDFDWANATSINADFYYLDGVNITDSIVNGTAGSGGGIDTYSFNFLVFENATSVYAINGYTGDTDYNGVFDSVLNDSLYTLRSEGGKIIINPGNYTKSTNNSILVPSETEIEIVGGAKIWMANNLADGVSIFTNMNSSNNHIVIHGDGILDGNKDNQPNNTDRSAVEFNGVSNSKVDIYMEHFKGYNVLDNKGTDDTNNVIINRFYPDAGKKISKTVHQMIQNADSWLIDNCSSGWAATFGTISYPTGDFVGANTSMKGVPGGAAAERMRFTRLASPSEDYDGVNFGIWVKGEGNFSEGWDMILEMNDGDANTAQWSINNKDDALNGSENVWTLLMFTEASKTYDGGINMSDVDEIRIRLLGITNTWNMSFDEFTAFPKQRRYPNGAVIFCFDGPYQHQWMWAHNALAKYGYKANVATSYDIPGEDAGNGGTYLGNLTTMYNNGWDVVVYSRAFDTETPPRPWSEAEVLDFALRQKQWLIDNGFTRSADYLQANRHLGDTTTYHLFSDYFRFQKIAFITSLAPTNLPELHFSGASRSYAVDAAAINEANRNGWIYLFFNHFNLETYTEAEFQAIVEIVHNNEMEVLTWSDLYEDLLNPPDPTQTVEYFMDVLAADISHVVAAEDLTAATPIVCTIAAQTDIPRNIRINITDGDTSISAFQIDIVGMNSEGYNDSEQFLFADGLDQNGSVAWARIDSITVTSIVGDGGGDVLDVGIEHKLGLSKTIYFKADIYKIKKNNADQAPISIAETSTLYNTYDMSTIGISGGDDFTIWYFGT